MRPISGPISGPSGPGSFSFFEKRTYFLLVVKIRDPKIRSRKPIHKGFHRIFIDKSKFLNCCSCDLHDVLDLLDVLQLPGWSDRITHARNLAKD